jgi:hypothetical protein
MFPMRPLRVYGSHLARGLARAIRPGFWIFPPVGTVTTGFLVTVYINPRLSGDARVTSLREAARAFTKSSRHRGVN